MSVEIVRFAGAFKEYHVSRKTLRHQANTVLAYVC